MEFLDIMWEIRDRCPRVDWELFAITAWKLWNNRNNIKHGGKNRSVEGIVKEAEEYAKEVRQVQQVSARPPPTAKSHWTPPRPGCYKINVDGAVFKDGRGCGV